MPGVSSESYVPGSFFNGGVNGDLFSVFEQSPGFEASGAKFLSREEVNFINERRFLAKSLSFGCDPLSNGDDLYENGGKEEGFDAASAVGLASLSPASFRSSSDEVCALHKYLPSNNEEEVSLAALGVEAYSCDEFRMYEFKVRRCMRGRSHDWTECPFAHPGEKARRRDPRRFLYCGTACPDFRKGSCRRGDACEFAHGVFECWLHPGRYRTQPCKDGRNCRRRVCFFAHTPQQLRLLPPSANASTRASKNHHGYDGSPLRHAVSAAAAAGSGSSSSFDGAGAGAGAALALGLEGMSSNHGGCLTSPRGYFSKPSLYPVASNSPTSTLVGYSHSQSPPSLSPPLSPAASPPHSPSSWPLACGVWNPSSCKKIDNTSAGFTHNPLNFSEVSASASASATPFGLRYPTITIPSSLDGLSSSKALSSGDVSYTPPSQHSPKAMGDLVSSLQCLEINNGGGAGGGGAPSLWVQPQMACIQSGSSPRPSNLRHCYSYSLPATPTKSRMDNKVDLWQADLPEWASEPVQRVESGRDLRAKIYGRLNRENNTNLANANNNSEPSPDLGWVNELVK